MIIKGRSRSGADELSAHLGRVDTNERMEVLEVRGVVAQDVKGALREMAAVAAGTRCKSNLYHASINVRAEERIDAAQWRETITTLETRLGLTGQPRVVVMHEKHGREHVHIVWSRINVARMCAIPDSHNYRAHEEVSREMERVFGHAHTQGAHHDRGETVRPDRTLSHKEQQQASRTGVDIVALKAEVTALWQTTDTGRALKAALAEKGYILAQGNRRDFVIVDSGGGIHSLARRIEGVRDAQVRNRLHDVDLSTLQPALEARLVQRDRAETDRGVARIGDALTPIAILNGLLKTRSYVTEAELLRAMQVEDLAGADAAIAALRSHEQIVALYEQSSNELVGFTTKVIRAQEQALVVSASKMAVTRGRGIAVAVIDAECAALGLSDEQAAAARHALSGPRLSIIRGRAGTGKSSTLSAIRRAAERARFDVIGLAPTNSVTEDLRESGFSRASTLHSLLWYRTHAPGHPNARIGPKTLLVVDEAAMLDTTRLAELVSLAAQTKAHLLLVGDDKQLASIERGGMFDDLAATVGAAELTTVRRQDRHWARRASEAFSQGRFRDGLEAFADRGLIAWSGTLGDSRAALLARYERDTREERGKRFIFAYTNDEVRRLNDAVQALEIERGRVRDIRTFETERGTLRVGAGDRIAFRGTDKKQGILNGALATVQAIEDRVLTVRTDRGNVMAVDLDKFDAIDLGYSGTIYRGQGKTFLDDVYLFHTRHWRDAASYVALTRSRSSTHVFVARDQARDLEDLANQMSRQNHRGSTLDLTDQPGSERDVQRTSKHLDTQLPRSSHRDKDQGLENS